MPMNERKIISIILEECAKIPERCTRYREELLATITDIVQAERQHIAHGTHIQQRVNDKFYKRCRHVAPVGRAWLAIYL